MLNKMKSANGGKKLAFILGIAIAIFVSANFADANQIINDALQVNSLKVGQQGSGGVTFFNGTIINETTGDGDSDNPVTFGDNVRIDGRVYRGATAGSGDSQPFIINDNLEVVGSLTVGSTNILSSISSLNSTTSSLQSQINTKGVGDMLKSTYDVDSNGKIDVNKISSGSVSDAMFNYLTGLSLNNDSGMRLTALGINAGNSLQTTGVNNTLIGYDAGASMTTADESVAIGSGAMALTTDALRNIAIGHNALRSTTSAPDNVVIGHSAMEGAIGNANSNVSIGNYSMNKQVGGVMNVAIGYEALYTGTNQSFNVGIGYQALRSATGGGGFGDTGNIGIGYRAGDNITDGTKNLIIGYDVDAVSATGDYQLNIGNIIRGSLDPTAPGLSINSGFALTPSTDQSKAAASTITIDNGIVRVVGNGGAVVLGNPAIENGAADGQIVIIQGTDDTNTVQISDNANTALTSASVTLGMGDNIQLMWDLDDSVWYEISRADN